jgi:hypothetical protein
LRNDLSHDPTDTSVFHFAACMFGLETAFRNPTPMAKIRQLRAEGLSLAAVARQTGSTVNVVRRVVGKLDKAAIRGQQEETAREIDSQPLPCSGKVALWKERTGQSEATFWRVLRRCVTSD